MKKQLKKSLLVLFSILGLAVPTITVGSVALVSCSSSDSNSNNTNNDQNNPSDPGGSGSGGTEVKPPVVDNSGRKYLEFNANIKAPKSFVQSAYLDKNIYYVLDWAIDEGKWFEDDGTPVTYVVKLTIDQSIYLSLKSDADVSKPCIDSVDWDQSNFWRLMDLSNKPLVMECEVAKKTNDNSFRPYDDFNFKSIYYDRNDKRKELPWVGALFPLSPSIGEAIYYKNQDILSVPSFCLRNNKYESMILCSGEYYSPVSSRPLEQVIYDDYKNFMIDNHSNNFFETDLYHSNGSHAVYELWMPEKNNVDYIGKLEIYPKNKK